MKTLKDARAFCQALLEESAALYQENRNLRGAGAIDNAIFDCFLDDYTAFTKRMEIIKNATDDNCAWVPEYVEECVSGFLNAPAPPVAAYLVKAPLTQYPADWEQSVQAKRAAFIARIKERATRR